MANEAPEGQMPGGLWRKTQSLHPPLDGGGDVDRHRGMKRLGNYTAQAGTAGNLVASNALHVGGLALIGGAVSATGIGLVAAGGALAVGSMVKSGRSWSKTSAHLEGLRAILLHKDEYTCIALPGAPADGRVTEHEYVANQILPYIISQKDKKLTRKKIGTFGGGVFVSLYQVGHAAFKKDRGKLRSYYAHVLATHLITHNCGLADDIVAELYSEPECEVIKRMDSDRAGDLLMDKMRSG